MGHSWINADHRRSPITQSQKRFDIADNEQLSNAQFSLSARDVEAIVNAADNPRDRALVRLFVETGIRRFEAANLEKRDLDQHTKILMVRYGKGNKARQIPLTSDLMGELVTLAGDGPYFFTSSRGGPLSLRQINRIVADAARVAGVRHPNRKRNNVTCHLLRHTFARLWKASGGSIESLSAILGHTSVKTTWDTYGRESLGDIQRNYDTTVERMFAKSPSKSKRGTSRRSER